MEIPQALPIGNGEELERKARFFARKLVCYFAAKNVPKFLKKICHGSYRDINAERNKLMVDFQPRMQSPFSYQKAKP